MTNTTLHHLALIALLQAASLVQQGNARADVVIGCISDVIKSAVMTYNSLVEHIGEGVTFTGTRPNGEVRNRVLIDVVKKTPRSRLTCLAGSAPRSWLIMVSSSFDFPMNLGSKGGKRKAISRQRQDIELLSDESLSATVRHDLLLAKTWCHG